MVQCTEPPAEQEFIEVTSATSDLSVLPPQVEVQDASAKVDTSNGHPNHEHHLSKSGLCSQVWQYTGKSWAELYHFGTGLELDCLSHHASSQSRLSLPSTSLRALQQLRTSLQVPGALELDVEVSSQEDGAQSVSDLFCRLVGQASRVHSAVGSTASASHEMRMMLEARAGKVCLWKAPETTDEDVINLDESVSVKSVSVNSVSLMEPPSDHSEVLDISICPLVSYPFDQSPSVVLLRLTSPVRINQSDSQPARSIRFAAVILCSSKAREATRFGREVGRALAIACMDIELVSALFMAPASSSNWVLQSFDKFLANMTVIPAVYMEPQSVPDEDVDGGQPNATASSIAALKTGYMLSDSLVDSIERRIRKGRGVSNGHHELERLHVNRRPREQHPPHRRRRYFVQVLEHVALKSGTACSWHVTQHLRQGLQHAVRNGAEELPHSRSQARLLSISATALGTLREIVTPQAVALDIDVRTYQATVDAVIDILSAGLPQGVLDELLKSLLEVQKPDAAYLQRLMEPSEGISPCSGDEVCNLLVLSSSAMPAKQGVVGAFVRLKTPMPDSLTGPDLPMKFLLVLAAPREALDTLYAVRDALAAMSLDEDLMGDLTLADSTQSFCSALDMWLGDVKILAHAPVQVARESLRGAQEPLALSSDVAPPVWVSVSTLPISELGMSLKSANVEVIQTPTIHSRYKWFIGRLQKYSIPLVTGVILAMAWENAHHKSYHDLTHTPIWNGASAFGHPISLHFIVNDLFMCFFFGLAIKEVTEAVLPGGSLYPLRRAVNPLMATLGGIVGPIAVYCLCVFLLDIFGSFDGLMCAVEDADASESRRLAGTNAAEAKPAQELCSLSAVMKGWGVPTATDISLAWMFALLVFGAGHPCINFLLLLAIVDDALGMVIIAIFYPDPKHPLMPEFLLLLFAAMAVSMILRYLKVQHWQFYVFLAGPISWYGLINAHVHPALALVCVVPFMPAAHARPKRHKSERHLSARFTRIGSILSVFSSGSTGERTSSSSKDQESSEAAKIAETIGDVSEERKERAAKKAAELIHRTTHAPLHAFEHDLKLAVDMGMFFFGLANAGVKMDSIGGVTAAVSIALLFGKTIGIAGFGLFAVSIGFDLPPGIGIGDLFASAALGGIGLTVALFVANQAFVDNGLRSQAKMGAVASVGCAAFAWVLQRLFGGKTGAEAQETVEPGEQLTDSIILSSIASSISFNEADDNIMPMDGVLPEVDGRASDGPGDDWIDDLLVDDILQTLWTQRRYQMRGTVMPVVHNRRSISKRRTSKDAPSYLMSGKGSTDLAEFFITASQSTGQHLSSARRVSKGAIRPQGFRISSGSDGGALSVRSSTGSDRAQPPQAAWVAET